MPKVNADNMIIIQGKLFQAQALPVMIGTYDTRHHLISMKHITLVAIAATIIPVPSRSIHCSPSHLKIKCNLLTPDFQRSCSDI